MLKKLDKKGFTIIEVLIVLAIAGLILLIVFLAVPALQRNSRNTSARNEAATVLGAVNEFVANNNGKLPAAGGSSSGDAQKVWNNVKAQTLLGITVEPEGNATLPTATNAIVVTTAKCANATSTLDVTGRGNVVDPGTSSRQFAILYVIETGSGNVIACTEG